MSPTRWRNCIKKVESHINVAINSDHFPLTCRMRFNLKAKHHTERRPQEFIPCDDRHRKLYNEQIKKQLKDTWLHDGQSVAVFTKCLKESATEHIPMKPKYSKKEELSKAAKEIMTKREEAWKNNNRDQVLQLTKELRIKISEDRRERIQQMISKDLEIRDRWMGINMLRKGYQPIPSTLKQKKAK